MRTGGRTVFQPLDAGGVLNLDGLATASPKAVLLPRCETLLEYHYSKGEEAPSRTSLEVREVLPDEPTLLFGARPCDVRGFTVFDRVYDAGSRRDVYYCSRRDNTLVAALACTKPDDTCFCHRVGGGPGDSTGADLLVTFIGEGYVIEAVTPRGDDFLSVQDLPEAGGRVEAARKDREAVAAAMPEGESLLGVPEQVNKLFDDQAFWEDVSAKCLSCGACSYLCPTCYCFNMTDEMHGDDGVRVRTWDNCMSFQFTLEGSGHNPRAAKAQRMRNRVGHKFNYYPALHGGSLACVGCGRCIAHCPVSMDVREIVSKAATRTLVEEEQAND
jgi:ferredoxin